jgi:translation initiation factor 1
LHNTYAYEQSISISTKNMNTRIKDLSGLAGLAQLGGLVVKETPPVSAADVAAVAESTAQVQRAKDVVRVQRETKGRGGKAVTLVKGISLPLVELEILGKQLKAACGSGGTVKDGIIEVQGDHIDRIVVLLNEQGYKAKRAGG